MTVMAEWASAEWWTWPAVAEVLGVGEAGGLTSAGVEQRSSAGVGQTSGQEQTSGKEPTSGHVGLAAAELRGLVVAEEDLQEQSLLEG